MKSDVTEIAAAEDISEGILRWCPWSHKAGFILLHSRGYKVVEFILFTPIYLMDDRGKFLGS